TPPRREKETALQRRGAQVEGAIESGQAGVQARRQLVCPKADREITKTGAHQQSHPGEEGRGHSPGRQRRRTEGRERGRQDFSGPRPAKYTVPPPPPLPPPPPPASLEERVALLQGRLSKQDETFQRRYLESFDMSWIYHDSALEGVVYSFQELKTAIDSSATVVQDSSLQPVCEDIRR